jgi:hypothetical protein
MGKMKEFKEYKEFRSSGVQEFRSSGVQEFRSSGVGGIENSKKKARSTLWYDRSPAPSIWGSSTPELLQLLNSYLFRLCISSAKVDGPPTFPGNTIKVKPGYAESAPSRRADTPEATCPRTRALLAFNPFVKTSFEVMPPFATNQDGCRLSLVGIPDRASDMIAEM